MDLLQRFCQESDLDLREVLNLNDEAFRHISRNVLRYDAVQHSAVVQQRRRAIEFAASNNQIRRPPPAQHHHNIQQQQSSPPHPKSSPPTTTEKLNPEVEYAITSELKDDDDFNIFTEDGDVMDVNAIGGGTGASDNKKKREPNKKATTPTTKSILPAWPQELMTTTTPAATSSSISKGSTGGEIKKKRHLVSCKICRRKCIKAFPEHLATPALLLEWRCFSCERKEDPAETAQPPGTSASEADDKAATAAQNDDECYVCHDGGDLLCCDYCPKSFHKQCHDPPYKRGPKGKTWKCCECKNKNQHKSPKRKSKEAMASSSGSSSAEKTTTKVDNNRSSPGRKTNNSTPGRKTNNSSPTKKRKKSSSSKQKAPPPVAQGENDDFCYICSLGGDLLCCDYCNKSFHLLCHKPPFKEVPNVDKFKCCECSARKFKKATRCGLCDNCIRPDCGTCKHCLDKPKFGGLGIQKQTCVMRICHFRSYSATANVDTVAKMSYVERMWALNTPS